MTYYQTTATAILLGMSFLSGTTWLFSAGRHPSEAPVLHAVRGVVLVNGQPAANVNVAFHPLNKDAYCPVGRTDDRGLFQLTTRTSSDGAPAGEYRVTLVWPDDSLEIDACECPDPLIHDRLKGLYAHADRSDFCVTVTTSGNSFKLSVWRPRGDDLPR